jgi:hypothetical protein
MNDRMILKLLDSERQTIADTEVTLEKTPDVVRAIGTETEGSWNGIVYSHFSITEAEEVIDDRCSSRIENAESRAEVLRAGHCLISRHRTTAVYHTQTLLALLE